MIVSNRRLSNVVTLTPETPEERSWLEANCDAESWQWATGGLQIDQRCAGDVVEGAIEAGFDVE